jgi:hypothetical protein
VYLEEGRKRRFGVVEVEVAWSRGDMGGRAMIRE